MKKRFTTLNVVTVASIIALFTLVYTPVTAQDGLSHCGLHHILSELYQHNPGMEAQDELNRTRMLEEGKRNLESNPYRDTSAPLYVIPVVFHVIHDYGTENISEAQILDQMMILNNDYRKMSYDTGAIDPEFAPLAADCQIEFRLAQLDPEGNCTNGIDRIASMETYVGDDGSKLNPWPREKYLNVWVVKSMMNGVAGYAYYPSTVDGFLYPFDGVIILQDYIGSIGTGAVGRSRALTHEIGHWLSLAHTWGNTNSPGVACGDDGILDTPATKGWTTCNLTNNAICTVGENENVENYMEYAYCSKMFTYGQRQAMHYALNSSVSHRNNLWQPANHIATGINNTAVTCQPRADFDVNRQLVCEGGTVAFTDLTWNSPATSWNWTITGPATLTSTLQNPTINFNTPGTYDVEFIASNSAGSDTILKHAAITVGPANAVLSPAYSESFEDPNVFYLGYVSNNRYGNGSAFQRTTAVAATGSGSVMLNNYDNTVHGDIDELITPSYYLSYMTNTQLSFKYAYATAATSNDLNTQVFKVYSSTDCGNTWNVRWTRSGAQVSTAGFYSSVFVPEDSSDWQTVTINLPGSVAQSNVRFKFEFTAQEDGTGNNLYLDDINIFGTVGISDPANAYGFTLFPNPGDGTSMINYNLTQEGNVQVEVLDISGRVVSTTQYGNQPAGQYQTSVSDQPLAPGVYLIRMIIDDKISTMKYIVNE